MAKMIIPPNLGPGYAFPLPQWVSLEDRSDGTVWYLTHRVSDSRFAISDIPPPVKQSRNVRHYSALDGPLISWRNQRGAVLRLLIRGGRLGYEKVTLSRATRDLDSPPTTTRRGNGPLVLTVKPLTWLLEGDAIGYEVTRE